MGAFNKQIRVDRPRDQVLGIALEALNHPFARVGFKLVEQDPEHAVWERKAPGIRALWASPDRITMSFGGTGDSGTLLTIAGNAPRRIARDFEKLEL